jgi:hypothetical protein
LGAREQRCRVVCPPANRRSWAATKAQTQRYSRRVAHPKRLSALTLRRWSSASPGLNRESPPRLLAVVAPLLRRLQMGQGLIEMARLGVLGDPDLKRYAWILSDSQATSTWRSVITNIERSGLAAICSATAWLSRLASGSVRWNSASFRLASAWGRLPIAGFVDCLRHARTRLVPLSVRLPWDQEGPGEELPRRGQVGREARRPSGRPRRPS